MTASAFIRQYWPRKLNGELVIAESRQSKRLVRTKVKSYTDDQDERYIELLA